MGPMSIFDLLVKKLSYFIAESTYDKEILRWARSEYKNDWEHAYHMLKQGKKPYTGV